MPIKTPSYEDAIKAKNRQIRRISTEQVEFFEDLDKTTPEYVFFDKDTVETRTLNSFDLELLLNNEILQPKNVSPIPELSMLRDTSGEYGHRAGNSGSKKCSF